MTAKYFRVWFAACLCALLMSHSLPSFANTQKHLAISPAYPSTISAGENQQLYLNITLLSPADSLEIRASGSGSLSTSWHQQVNSTDISVSVPFLATDTSESGTMTLVLTGHSANDAELFQQVFQLYAEPGGNQLYLDHHSPLYAKLAANQALAAKGSTATHRLYRAKSIETNQLQQPDKQYLADSLVAKSLPVRQQKALAATPVSMTVSGYILWTDSAGNTHELPGAVVQVYDDDLAGDDLLLETSTDATGYYTAAISDDDIVAGPDIYIRVLARSNIADIKAVTDGAETYYMESEVYADQEDGSTLTISMTADNTTTAGQAFSVHHALVAGGAYISLLNGSAPAQITTRFPTTESTSLFNGTELHILQLDRWDWDVILHEYGHYIMDAYNFEANPGGRHSFNTNLSTDRGSKDVGVKLAWGEGWPTFFATSGLYQMGFAAKGIPNVGDMQYQDTEDASISIHMETGVGQGEDDELSVMTALWDLTDSAADSEDIALAPANLFSQIKADGSVKIGDVWAVLVASADNELKARYGKLFGNHRISPQQLTPADRATLSTSTRFSWRKNGAGPDNPLNANHVRFFDSDFATEVHDEDVGDTDNYTPSADDVSSILASGNLVRWVVTGKNTTTPTTATDSVEYWSDVRVLNGASVVFVIDDTGSMSEEISGVSAALSNYITYLEASLGEGETPPTIHLLTFKDSVTHRLTTNDLDAMRTAVESLTASGGGDCPEYSAHGLLAASELVSDGGTILLATDASAQPGVDMAAVISDLRSRGVTVNTILSGDCSSESFKPSARPDSQGKPGGDEDGDEVGGTLTDAGTATAIDLIGDTIDSASEILVDNEVIGSIEEYTDTDMFKISLDADQTYSITLQNISSTSYVLLALLDSEGNTQPIKQSGYTSYSLYAYYYLTSPALATFSVDTGGDYYLRLTGNTGTAYRFATSTDPFNELVSSSVQLFSVVSAETGGAFAKAEEVNYGDDTSFVSTIYNILRSTTEPSVITSSIKSMPADATATVYFTGLNTNWNSSTSVSLLDSSDAEPDGISLTELTIHSPTLLSVKIAVADTATLQALNIITQTILGEETESAEGENIITIVAATSTETVLSLTPVRVVRGEDASLTIQAINTSFSDGMSVSLGSGVTVNDITIVSDTEASIDISVASSAPIGYRTLTVESNTLSDALLIGATSTVPVITALDPSSLKQGQTISLSVTGSGTHFVQDETSANFGSEIVVNSVTINSATEAIVNVSVNREADVGFYDVTLMTNDESATLLNGLYVDMQVFVAIPSVVGLSQSEATSTLEESQLTLGTVTTAASETVAAGLVISQSPGAGEEIAQGDSVDLLISTGSEEILIAVPDVTGLSQSAAEAAIEAAGLEVGTITQQNSSSVAEGRVISQSESAGSMVAEDTIIDLIISLGASSSDNNNSGGGGGAISLQLWLMAMLIGWRRYYGETKA